MKKIPALAFLSFMAISATGFASTLTSMSKVEVQQAFVGKTVTSIPTARLNGAPIDNTFTASLDAQGNVMGKFANQPTNAPQTDTGVYKIADDGSMTVTWKNWEGAKEICVQFYNTQNAYVAISCANEFHTVFMKSAIQAGNQLNAQK